MNDQMTALAARAEARCRSRFDEIDRIALLGTEKVLAAFAEERVQTGDFAGTTGYGYDDVGRDKLERIYARVLGGEAALVRTAFVNGTHAIACAMFGCDRPWCPSPAGSMTPWRPWWASGAPSPAPLPTTASATGRCR